MSEVPVNAPHTIAQAILVARIQQHEDVRRFFLTMYEQNPHLSATAGKRINDMLTPLKVLQQRSELTPFIANNP